MHVSIGWAIELRQGSWVDAELGTCRLGGLGVGHLVRLADDVADILPAHLDPIGMRIEVLEGVELPAKQGAGFASVAVLEGFDHLAAKYHEVLLTLGEVLVVEVGRAEVLLRPLRAVDKFVSIADFTTSLLDRAWDPLEEAEIIFEVLFEEALNSGFGLVYVGLGPGGCDIQKNTSHPFSAWTRKEGRDLGDQPKKAHDRNVELHDGSAA